MDLSLRQLFSDATTTDDSPTPGYMLNELARITISNYVANTQLQDLIVSRIVKNNHNVKYKCLLIIKHVCRTGRIEFKREMGQPKNLEPIKECLQFKGPPDPLRGDEIYKRVRDAARETLDAVFDSQMPVSTSAVAAANRIQGMGNDYQPENPNAGKSTTGGFLSSVVSTLKSSMASGGNEETAYTGHAGASGGMAGDTYSSGNGTAPGGYRGGDYNHPTSSGGTQGCNTMSNGSGGMVGLGNTNYKDSRNEKSWYESASAAASAVAAAPSSSWSNSAGNASSNSSNGGGDAQWGTGATNRGPNAFNSPGSPLGPGPGQYNPAQWNTGDATQPGRGGTASQDGGYEQGIIDSLCEPGGLKPSPPEDRLRVFLVSANTLSSERVGKCLLQVLCSEQWVSRAKGLVVISSLVSTQGCEAHSDWWASNYSAVQAMQSDPKVGVRTQANKTLRLLSRDGGVAEVAAIPPSRPTPTSSCTTTASSVADDLLGDDLLYYSGYSPASTIIQTAYTAPPAPAADDGMSLFSGMSISSPIPSPSSTGSVPTSSLPVPPSAMQTTAPAASTQSSSFDFLNFSSAAPLTPQPNEQQNLQISNEPADMFGGMTVSSPMLQAFTPVPADPALAEYSSDLADLSMSLTAPSSSSKMGMGVAIPVAMMMGNSHRNSISNSMTMNPTTNANTSKNLKVGMNMNQPIQQANRPPQYIGGAQQQQQQQYNTQQQYMQQHQQYMQPQLGIGSKGGHVQMGGIAGASNIPMQVGTHSMNPSPSGFAFLGSNGGSSNGSSNNGSSNSSNSQNRGVSDSFSFVTDLMK